MNIAIIIVFTVLVTLLLKWFFTDSPKEVPPKEVPPKVVVVPDHSLQDSYDKVIADNSRLHRDNRELRSAKDGYLKYAERFQKELQELRKGTSSDLIGIKFNALHPTTGVTKTHFKLGEGPCGKTVSALTFTEESDRYILTQFCDDGSRKSFTYLKSEMVGRIEREFKAL